MNPVFGDDVEVLALAARRRRPLPRCGRAFKLAPLRCAVIRWAFVVVASGLLWVGLAAALGGLLGLYHFIFQ